MRTHAKWIWIVVFVAFVGGFLLYEVSGLGGRSGPTTSTVVASVNGRDIGYIQWVNASQQLAQQKEQFELELSSKVDAMFGQTECINGWDALIMHCTMLLGMV